MNCRLNLVVADNCAAVAIPISVRFLDLYFSIDSENRSPDILTLGNTGVALLCTPQQEPQPPHFYTQQNQHCSRVCLNQCRCSASVPGNMAAGTTKQEPPPCLCSLQYTKRCSHAHLNKSHSRQASTLGKPSNAAMYAFRKAAEVLLCAATYQHARLN